MVTRVTGKILWDEGGVGWQRRGQVKLAAVPIKIEMGDSFGQLANKGINSPFAGFD